jgi:hypothetical protein
MERQGSVERKAVTMEGTYAVAEHQYVVVER